MDGAVFDWTSLPVDIILKILNSLDIASLAQFRQLSKFMKNLIDQSASLQYKFELAIAGMEDGPPSGLGASERLDLLRRRQASWDGIGWCSRQEHDTPNNITWHLYGGVLAQARKSDSITFTQLPSVFRGIEKKVWNIDDIGFTIEDFKMDPAQDLLMLIESPLPSQHNEFRIHLHSMVSGKSHPAARNTPLLTSKPHRAGYTWYIKICEDLLGILFVNIEQVAHELLVWNWKTGVLHLWLQGRSMTCFEFLTDHHLVLTCLHLDMGEGSPHPPPTIVVVDVLADHSLPVQFPNLNFVCMFQYPRLDRNANAFHLTICSDPSPSWRPSPALSVPFYTSRQERLFVLTFWLLDAGNALRSVLLFIPSSTLISRIDSLDQAGHKKVFVWNEWGKRGTHMMDAPMGHSPIWASYVFGMKYIAPKWSGSRWGFQLFDFNQLAVRRQPHPPEDGVSFGPDQMTIRTDGRFSSTVTTSLPYRCIQLRPQGPPPITGSSGISWEGVLLSEDTIVSVGLIDENTRKYRIHNF